LGSCGRWLISVRGMGYAWRPEPSGSSRQ
jgi:hypothetical protein